MHRTMSTIHNDAAEYDEYDAYNNQGPPPPPTYEPSYELNYEPKYK